MSALASVEEAADYTSNVGRFSVALQESRTNKEEILYADFIETIPFADHAQLWQRDWAQKLQKPLSLVALDCEMCDTEVLRKDI